MATQNHFSPLVRHEFKWGVKRKNRTRSNTVSGWVLLYASIGLLVGIGILTFWSLKGLFQPQYLWYALGWMPFWALGLAHNVIRREWQFRTYGWWLALPYARTKLINTKFVACFLQLMTILVGLFVILTILAMYTMLLRGMQFDQLGAFLLWGMYWFSFALFLLPIMISFGMMSATLIQSRLKPVLPLFWIVFWIAGSGFMWLISIGDRKTSAFEAMKNFNQVSYFPINTYLIVFVLLSWVLTYFILRFTARVLEKSLDL